MSQFIDEFCNDLANINDNFLKVELKEKTQRKMKVELIQKNTLTSIYYVIRVDGELHMTYSKYDDAMRDYDKIKTSEQGEQVLNSKEV